VSNVEEHPFAQYVRLLGKGKTGTRSLTREQARDAFSMILEGRVEALQLGAFLMLLRVKEETTQEIAGFVDACRLSLSSPPASLKADLDWSSYAGKKNQHPWFILSWLLLAQAGYRVFIHGASGHNHERLYCEQAMRQLDLPVAANWGDAEEQLAQHRISFLPLKAFCKPLDDILRLRNLLGLRSPVNTLTRVINPLRAHASLQSVFHPSYGEKHQGANKNLGQKSAIVFKGEGGEIEVRPHADTLLHLWAHNQAQELTLPRVLGERQAAVDKPSVAPLRELWRADSSTDHYGEQAVIATTSVALLALNPDSNLETQQQRALQLWQARDQHRLA